MTDHPSLFDFSGPPLRAPKKARAAKSVAPSIVDKPLGARDVMRPDLVKPKPMGWAVFASHRLEVFLDMVVQRPNEGFRGMSQGAMMGMRAKHAKTREWTKAALAQCNIAPPGAPVARPQRVTLTRISSGKMDDDGLVGSFKHVRDGVAFALGFDDREFSIGGMRSGGVPIWYEQRAPGKRGAMGVLIEIAWAT